MKEFEFTTNFSSVVKPLVSTEKDEYLALASMAQLEDFLPQIDTEKNIDLLPIAFNACVANRVNKNGDVIDTQAAAELCQSFVNKQINLEHNREKVVGVILKAGFSGVISDICNEFANGQNFKQVLKDRISAQSVKPKTPNDFEVPPINVN